VRPARIHAHEHLQKRVLGSKAGSTQTKTCHRGGSPRHGATRLASLHTGLEARRALGAEHDGAARGGPQSFQQNNPRSGLNECVRSTRPGVATAPGSRR
jgi:hypothetical protein